MENQVAPNGFPKSNKLVFCNKCGNALIEKDGQLHCPIHYANDNMLPVNFWQYYELSARYKESVMSLKKKLWASRKKIYELTGEKLPPKSEYRKKKKKNHKTSEVLE